MTKYKKFGQTFWLKFWPMALITLFTCGQMSAALTIKVGRALSGSGQSVNVLHMKGVIFTTDWSQWMQAEASLDPQLNTLVVIDSPGGQLGGGLFMIRTRILPFLQREKAAGHTVVILASKDCSSMCLPVFNAFSNRLAVSGTRFGWHGVSLSGLGTDPLQTSLYLDSLYANAKSQNNVQFVQWLNEHGRTFSGNKLEPISAESMAEQNSGFINKSQLVGSEAEALLRLP